MIAYIIADCFFRESAFEDSNNFVVNLQKTLSSKFFSVFFIIFCDILHPIIAAVLLILYYALTLQKVKTLSFIIYFITTTYICSILKIFYHDPRPYFEDSDIEAKECYSEYGNPSGHSMGSILLFGMFWVRYLWSLVKYGEVKALDRFQYKQFRKEEQALPLNGHETVEILESGLEINQNKEEIKNNKANESDRGCFFFISTFLLLLIEFFILFGRIYLGMHSYNEVLLGLFYGIYFLVFYYLFVEKKMMRFIEMIILRNYRLKLKGNLFDWRILLLLAILYVFIIILPIFLYEIYSRNLTFPLQWVESVHKHCPENSPIKMFLNKCFADCGVMGVVFGVLFGIFFTNGEYYSLKVMYSHEGNPHYIFLKDLTFKKQFVRVIVILLFAGAWAAIFAVIPNNNSVYLCFFINNHLGTFLTGFFLLKLVPIMNHFLKIEYKKDFLKYHNGDLVVHVNNSIPYEEIKN